MCNGDLNAQVDDVKVRGANDVFGACGVPKN